MSWDVVGPIALFILVGMLVVIGTQIFFILKEFQKTVQKVNKVLDDGGTISESISKPINMASSALMGIKGGAMIARMFSKKKKQDE